MIEVSTPLNQSMVHDDIITRMAYARDASLYRMMPEFVARPKNTNDVIELLSYAKNTKTPITFRAGGTSLSGQSISEGVLAEVLHEWKQFKIHDSGKSITMQPGVNGGFANKILEPYMRKLGPDPASINAACIGGIVSNNSSGMLCGTRFNSYHTLKDISFILPNGNQYSTSLLGEHQRFIDRERKLVEGIVNIRKELHEKECDMN